MERTVGIRELKNNLSRILKLVKDGHVVAVSDRNKRVALLLPVGQRRMDEKIDHLVETGLLSWQGGKPGGAERPGRSTAGTVSDAVLEERR